MKKVKLQLWVKSQKDNPSCTSNYLITSLEIVWTGCILFLAHPHILYWNCYQYWFICLEGVALTMHLDRLKAWGYLYTPPIKNKNTQQNNKLTLSAGGITRRKFSHCIKAKLFRIKLSVTALCWPLRSAKHTVNQLLLPWAGH